MLMTFQRQEDLKNNNSTKENVGENKKKMVEEIVFFFKPPPSKCAKVTQPLKPKINVCQLKYAGLKKEIRKLY